MSTISKPSKWIVTVKDGMYHGVSHKYSPEALIKVRRTRRYVASIRLTSIGYSGTARDRKQDERTAREIAAVPELLEIAKALQNIPACEWKDWPELAALVRKSEDVLIHIKHGQMERESE